MADPISVFTNWEKQTPDTTLFHQPLTGRSVSITYADAGQQIRKVAAALQQLNLPARSKIAILSKNCAHWIMSDLAIWMAGHISVPLYPTLTAHSIKQILDHSESKVIFVGKLDEYATQKNGISDQVQKISFPWFGIEEGLRWDDLVKNNKPLASPAQWTSKELATIKYTSGTTGTPKGVMISFNAFDVALTHAIKELGFEKERFFSYLPLSHIAERMLVELGAIYTGSTIYFSESLEKFPANLMEAKPTIFLAVPRIWAKFREKILEKMPQKKLDRLLSIPLVSSIVKGKISSKLGLNKARWKLTGASPISKELLDWYAKLGIIIHEVYGMTENLAYSHINLHEVKFGSVGKVWTNVEARISDEGEIQTRSAASMLGYYKEPGLTSEMLTPDGFIKTGDKGEVDARGFLTITGRIKDLFKTDKGKYIAPSPIELKLMSNTDIEQVCVVGMGVPQPMALVVLSPTGKAKSKADITTSLQSILTSVNERLESYEKLEAAVIMKSDWTVENGLITPSLKVKRNEVEKIHLPKYPTWYNSGQKVIWES